jgi:hypothetical protein
MPSLSDIFNPSFFMCLGILVLLTALIVVYFETKMREQNHKIASMLSLVSSLAEEQNNLRMEVFRMVTTGQTNSGNNFPVNSFPANSFINKNENSDLINVSDDEDDSGDDSDDDSGDDDDDSNDSTDSGSEDDLEENEVIELGENDIKVLKININNKETNNEDDDFNIEEIDNLEELGENTDEDDDIDDDSIINEIDELVSSDDELKEETIVPTNLNNLEEPETSKIDLNAIDFKQISISGLENELSDNETMDYKKLSLNKLKSLVVEKGLTKDSSKLKKNELLNLLGVK